MPKQIRDNVFELFNGRDEDIPETPLEVARPTQGGVPIADGSAVDLTGKPKIIMLMAAGASGKAQPNDSMVLTPTGFRPMGSLSRGDLVTGHDGRSASIVGVFPQGEKEIYQVEFHDGRKVECCEDHLWKMWYPTGPVGPGSHATRKRLASGEWRVAPLRTIREWIQRGEVSPRRKRWAKEIAIPSAVPYALELPPADLPISGYALGALLGNGHFGRGCIGFSSGDPETVAKLQSELPGYELALTGNSPYDYRIRRTEDGKAAQRAVAVAALNDKIGQQNPAYAVLLTDEKHGRRRVIKMTSRGTRGNPTMITCRGESRSLAQWAEHIGTYPNMLRSRLAQMTMEEALGFEPKPPINRDAETSPLVDAIDSLGLLGLLSYEKFIPEIYKRGSVSQRIALLQGLMDTDGSADGSFGSYSSSSERLALDVQQLAWSLGAIASISGRQTYFTHKGIRKAGRPSWRVNIVHPDISQIFSLPRKLAKCRPQSRSYRLRIEAITAIGRKAATCIAIDHPDHLYVTNNYVVTHNSTMARWIVERALNREDGTDLVLASADAKNPTLKRFFPDTMIPKSAGGAPQFMLKLLDRLVETRRTAVIDLCADMTLAPILEHIPDLQQVMADAGVEPVVFYLLTPRQSDLTVLKTMEIMEFRPSATCLLLNIGRTTNPYATREEQDVEFARIRKHSAYRGAIARGAVEAWMPRLWSARDIEDKHFGFHEATNGGRLGISGQRQTSHWLGEMERVLAPISSWLP